jgi:hypothetical protein
VQFFYVEKRPLAGMGCPCLMMVVGGKDRFFEKYFQAGANHPG